MTVLEIAKAVNATKAFYKTTLSLPSFSVLPDMALEATVS